MLKRLIGSASVTKTPVAGPITPSGVTDSESDRSGGFNIDNVIKSEKDLV